MTKNYFYAKKVCEEFKSNETNLILKQNNSNEIQKIVKLNENDIETIEQSKIIKKEYDRQYNLEKKQNKEK